MSASVVVPCVMVTRNGTSDEAARLRMAKSGTCCPSMTLISETGMLLDPCRIPSPSWMIGISSVKSSTAVTAALLLSVKFPKV